MLLVVSAGHIKKKLLLAVFRLCRKLFIEKLAYRLGFRSKKAIEDFKRVSIGLFTGMASEKEKPTPNHFTEWRKNEVKNANYHLYYDVTFNLLLELKCFRAGIRRNNSLFALAGRQKVVPIMFIGNHMIYRDIIVNNMQIRVEAPDDVDKFIAQNELFSYQGITIEGREVTTLTKLKTSILKVICPLGYLQ